MILEAPSITRLPLGIPGPVRHEQHHIQTVALNCQLADKNYGWSHRHHLGGLLSRNKTKLYAKHQVILDSPLIPHGRFYLPKNRSAQRIHVAFFLLLFGCWLNIICASLVLANFRVKCTLYLW